jgi:uncharacterized protein
MIIDAHTHVYLRPCIVPPARTDGTTFMSVDQQIEFMNELGIDRAVVLPLTNAEAPAEPQSLGEILTIAEMHPNRFIPYCNIDPRLPKSPSSITKEDFLDLMNQYKDAGCRGVGELTARVPWSHPSLLAMLEACEEIGFPVTFHTITPAADSYGVLDEPGLPGLEAALKSFPELIFTGHSQAFWSEISGDLTESEKNGYPGGAVVPGGAVPRLMRSCPNLYADLSAGSGFNALARDERYALEFIEEFGDRLFFGLDCNRPVGQSGLLTWMTEHVASGALSRERHDAIMGGNLLRVLELE